MGHLHGGCLVSPYHSVPLSPFLNHPVCFYLSLLYQLQHLSPKLMPIPSASVSSLTSVSSAPSHSLQSHQHILFQPFICSKVFSHLFFTALSSNFFPPLFFLFSSSPMTKNPSSLLFLSLPLGTIRASDVSQRMIESL